MAERSRVDRLLDALTNSGPGYDLTGTCENVAGSRDRMTSSSQLLPQRGDDVEAWLKRRRDSFPKNTRQWSCIDDLLDDYRLHADTGSHLDEEDISPWHE